ncbi:diaminobutyrate acetyltransferase [Nitriliruptoraceae bacterium ZYF776]|nr:diaminobutyrate acetyltransferase [Profundirhabdus halotolerans]
MPTDTLVLRHPTLQDGAALYELVRDGGGLDRNSPYAYLLLADRFSATSLVAEEAGGTAGFIAGLPLPEDPGTLFVWQIGVAPSHRGRGLGRRMLVDLAQRSGARYLEASVTPSNTASRRLFRGFARELGVPCHESAWLEAGHFPAGEDHEPEDRFRIGPLPR